MIKGKIPITQKIEIESTKDQWMMLNTRIINRLECTALIFREKESRVRIKLQLVYILKPQDRTCENRVRCVGPHENIQGGLERVNNFFIDFYSKTEWLMFGYIMGENPKPIMITYFECFDFAVYTTKFDKNHFEKLLPEGAHLN